MMLAAVVLGGVAVLGLQRESMPRTQPDEVEVRVLYPGASALDVEEGICRPLEEALSGVSFVEEVRAEAREGQGTVTIEMLEGEDFSEFQSSIQREVDALDTLPPDAEEPVLEALGLEDKVLAIHVASGGSLLSLKAYCEDLERRLRLLPEVSMVEGPGVRRAPAARRPQARSAGELLARPRRRRARARRPERRPAGGLARDPLQRDPAALRRAPAHGGRARGPGGVLGRAGCRGAPGRAG